MKEQRRIIVENVRPAIPIREFDWCATFVGYEPGEPQGYGATKQAAIDDLMSKADDAECDCPTTAGGGNADDWCGHTGGECKARLQPTTVAVRDVLAERERQKNVEGWKTKHDDEHSHGELAAAAACYAAHSAGVAMPRWPWDASWWKPTNTRRDLVKAGALILAEIERLDRSGAQS